MNEEFQKDIGQSPYTTRYLCDILIDLRKCYKTRNFSYMMGLLEELQYRAYRMEQAMDLSSEIEYMEKERIRLKKEIKELREEKKEIVGEDSDGETD